MYCIVKENKRQKLQTGEPRMFLIVTWFPGSSGAYRYQVTIRVFKWVVESRVSIRELERWYGDKNVDELRFQAKSQKTLSWDGTVDIRGLGNVQNRDE